MEDRNKLEEKKKELIDFKEHVKKANEKRKTEPNHVSVKTIDALIEVGLIDEEGNIKKSKTK